MLISAVATVAIGYSLSKIHYDIKLLNAFLSATENVESNFEKSLQLYTEGTEEAISHIHSLRPDDESKYIDFISQIEDTGTGLDLDLSLRSIELSEKEASTKGNTLDYQLSLYGDENSVIDFIQELENMPYYLKIYSIEYSDLDYLEDDNSKLTPNIKITIRLYVK